MFIIRKMHSLMCKERNYIKELYINQSSRGRMKDELSEEIEI